MYLPTIIVTLAIVSASETSSNFNAKNERYLDLTVSAKTHKIKLVWENLEENGSIVVKNGPDDDSQVLVEHTIESKDGWKDTDIIYNYTHFRNVITVDTSCYGFYAYYKSQSSNFVSDVSTCMMAYPKWMETMKRFIGPLRFREIFLPGSHDAAAYKLDFDPGKDENIANKYVLTQDEDIRGQLLAGVRYLDIRPAYYPLGTIRFWINHGVTRVQPMEQVLQDVYNFVLETNEIVIVDFHQFPVGFNSHEIHRMLVQFVNETIGDQVVTIESGWDTQLDQIWNQSKRIILGYNDGSIISEYFPFTWPAISHRWANVDEIEPLKQYLYKVNNDPITSMIPVSDMAQMTPTTNGVIIDKYKGLRKMADASNPLASEWYRHDLGPKANIVSLEFLRGTTIIKDGMKLNTNRTD